MARMMRMVSPNMHVGLISHTMRDSDGDGGDEIETGTTQLSGSSGDEIEEVFAEEADRFSGWHLEVTRGDGNFRLGSRSHLAE